jgi:hypothetical protein
MMEKIVTAVTVELDGHCDHYSVKNNKRMKVDQQTKAKSKGQKASLIAKRLTSCSGRA